MNVLPDMAFDLGTLKGSVIYVYNMADQSTMYEFHNPIMDKNYPVEKCYARTNSIHDSWISFFKLTNSVKINKDMVCSSHTADGQVIVTPNTLFIIDNLTDIIRSHKSKWEKFLWNLS